MLRGFRQESTVQTFEVYLSPKVRQAYDRAFAGVLDSRGYDNRGQGRRRGQGGAGAANNRRRGFRAAPEEGVSRHRELNRFLMGFLGTPTSATADGANVEGGRPEVRSKRYWESLIGLPPEMGYSPDRSVFLEDTSGRFKRLLLAGRETDLIILQILTYALVDMSTANTYAAIFTTYAVDLLVRVLRSELATRNIATKTLLDDRFLL